MSKTLIRDVLKFTFGTLAVSSIIIPIQFSQAQENQGIALDQKTINSTSEGSEERKEICGKLKKDFPFWKTMKILGIDSSEYKYYAQYYNVVESVDKYNGKANQNYNLQLSLYNNCETIPNIDSIKEGNIYENIEASENEEICKKSPLYIEHGIYEEGCKFSNKCENGYEYIGEKSICEKVIKNEIVKDSKKEEISVNKVEYNQEEINAYQWAKEQGITTMDTIDEARLSEPLTRAELAKMITIFAKDVLGKDFVIEESIGFTDVNSSLGDLEEYVNEIYKLQIMGTGDKNKMEFYPNAYVTRAEFATVLSRLLFGDRFNQEGENWYAQHLYILKKAKLLDNTRPEELEMKGSVLLMLYKLQGIGVFSNLIPKENPIMDKIEKLGSNVNENEEIIEEKIINEEGTGIQLNYDGVLLHVGFATDDYKQTLVQYAYKLGGMDFVYMIECENGNWDINAIGDSGHAFGLCQMNDRYHKNIPEDYKTNGIVQVEYCYEKRKGGTKFYGPSRWVKGQRCYNYVKNRFSIVG